MTTENLAQPSARFDRRGGWLDRMQASNVKRDRRVGLTEAYFAFT